MLWVMTGPRTTTTDLPDCGRREGLALMWATTVVAVVRLWRAVVDQPSRAVAMIPTAPQLRVEGVHDSGVQRPDLLRSEEWADVLLRIALVGVERVVLQLGVLEVTFEHLVDSRVRAWMSALVDLVEETDSGLFSKTLGLRWRRY